MQSADAASTIDEMDGSAGAERSGAAEYDWNDVELSNKARKTVREISRRAGAGLRVTALFSGPARADKARAAALLARDLDRELLQVSLSSLARQGSDSSQAQLAALLSSAGADSTVLLFDDADALFGRGRDGAAAAAALEEQLLRCMDGFPGLAILAADHCRRIDPAVVRRLHYAVKM